MPRHGMRIRRIAEEHARGQHDLDRRRRRHQRRNDRCRRSSFQGYGCPDLLSRELHEHVRSGRGHRLVHLHGGLFARRTRKSRGGSSRGVARSPPRRKTHFHRYHGVAVVSARSPNSLRPHRIAVVPNRRRILRGGKEIGIRRVCIRRSFGERVDSLRNRPPGIRAIVGEEGNRYCRGEQEPNGRRVDQVEGSRAFVFAMGNRFDEETRRD
mmetsp:Transcript_23912/g.50393  ORF Transcript_23912/g.50393 Transcript_23912/m.50393 type:complete len:211 (+) Transcript_23912:1283-1915(+)